MRKFVVVEWNIPNDFRGGVTGTDISAIVPVKDWNKDRQLQVGPEQAHKLGIPPGEYNHVGENPQQLWVYRKERTNG